LEKRRANEDMRRQVEIASGLRWVQRGEKKAQNAGTREESRTRIEGKQAEQVEIKTDPKNTARRGCILRSSQKRKRKFNCLGKRRRKIKEERRGEEKSPGKLKKNTAVKKICRYREGHSISTEKLRKRRKEPAGREQEGKKANLNQKERR